MHAVRPRAKRLMDQAAKLQRLGKFGEALPIAKQAYDVDPGSPHTWFAFGMALLAVEDTERALVWLYKAYEAMPDQLEAQYYLGHACLLLGKDELATTWLEQVMQHPDLRKHEKRIFVIRALGDLYYRTGRTQDALRLDLEVITDRTVGAHADHVRALTWLRHGDYPFGWTLNERRIDIPEWRERRRFNYSRAPRAWDGESKGRVLFLGEQGMGDCLQMMRYVPGVAARSGQLVPCHVPPELVEVFRGLPGTAEVTGYGEPMPHADYSMIAMSAPYTFGTLLDTIPPPQSPGQGWVQPSNERPRIGICWRGSDYTKYTGDRSCYDPAALAPLWTLPVEWVSLQHDVVPPAGAPFEIARFDSFAHTADVMRTLDAVVTVDTSVVHLAGTLGVPTWLMPPVVPEWRWTLDEPVSPWYPSVRLVRRQRRDDWPDAIAWVANDLKTHLKRPHAEDQTHLKGALTGALLISGAGLSSALRTSRG